MQHKPILPVTAGGVQPYARAGGQPPGPALTAMLAGRTLYGFNPQDIVRNAQTARPQLTLLDLLRRQ